MHRLFYGKKSYFFQKFVKVFYNALDHLRSTFIFKDIVQSCFYEIQINANISKILKNVQRDLYL